MKTHVLHAMAPGAQPRTCCVSPCPACPSGCGEPATHELRWIYGGCSYLCDQHAQLVGAELEADPSGSRVALGPVPERLAPPPGGRVRN